MESFLSPAALVVRTFMHECPGGHGGVQCLQMVEEVAACCRPVEGILYQPKHDSAIGAVSISCAALSVRQRRNRHAARVYLC